MMNGLLTLRGAWDRLRTDPILKFFVLAVTFYGMATFEGPMMSVKFVNSLSHYTDWTIAHVHGGALGWNGFIAFGMIYWLVPRLWSTKIWSERLVSTHLWIATIGIVLYITSMWTAGITQGLMWRAFNDDGNLKYPDFIQTVVKLIPYYWFRAIGGTLYLAGMITMAVNVFMTVRLAKRSGVVLADTKASAYALVPENADEPLPAGLTWHYRLEGRAFTFSVLTLVAVVIGGMVEIIPMAAVSTNVPTIASVKPYTPLELEGRDIYVREGCYNCHSQMIRPFRDEVVRYGEYSKSGEFVYDHPFQFGSKRSGPDLHRVGGKYPNMWHYRHMQDPRSTTPGSIMPAYSWLYSDNLDTSLTERKLSVMKKLGVPYTVDDIRTAKDQLEAQARTITEDLVSQGADRSRVENKEIVALIAYLQRLGTDIKVK
jgi:cytochrome c oxidase cbb3-type subunit I/II